MVRELSHRGEEKARLLAYKDREIQDYKEQGVEVSRSGYKNLYFVFCVFCVYTVGIFRTKVVWRFWITFS